MSGGAFACHGVQVSLDDIITMVEETSEESWQTEVVRSADGTRNCFFGHLHALGVTLAADVSAEALPRSTRPDITPGDYIGSRLWDWFESAWATTYAIYPVNDGTNPAYPQQTPRQRVLAYLRALHSGMELTTEESLDDQFHGRFGGEDCGVAYPHLPLSTGDDTVCRRCKRPLEILV
jgi:hypothetical protein